MILIGDRFRRKSDGSMWVVAGFLNETVKPGEEPVHKAALGRMDDSGGPETTPVEDLKNEVGWQRE